MKLSKLLFCITLSMITAYAFASGTLKSDLQALSPQIANWSQQTAIVSSVQQSNLSHANLSKAQIKSLNAQWKQQLQSANKPLITKVNGNALSLLLQKIAEQSKGLYQNILVLDQYGLIVGQTYVPNEYYQAHQTTWKKAMKANVTHPYIKVSTPLIAMPILDKQAKTIGVVEVAINKSMLDSTSQS